MENKPKIMFISTDWGNNKYRKENNKGGAVSQYRLVNPMKYLTEYFDITYVGADFVDGSEGLAKDALAHWYKRKFEGYDLVVSKLTDNSQAGSAIRFMTQYLKIPLVVDIDDNIWEVKSDNPGYDFYRKGAKKLSHASTYISMADYVWCSTQPLADYFKTRMTEAYNEDKPVTVLPNCIDPDNFKFTKAKLDDNKITIGWQGSTTHHNDLKVALPAIAKLMKEYPNLHLELLGGVIADKVVDLLSDFDEETIKRVNMKDGGDAYDTFPKMLSEQAWDIAIAPLTDDEFNRAKSHIKWLEYAMYEIPCVASEVYPYYRDIQDTVVIEGYRSGMITSDAEWYSNLKNLIDDKKARIQMGKIAKQQVLKNWDIKNHAYKWKKAIDLILKR